MIGLVDAAAEVASTKHSDVKPVEIPKEIGESKSKLSDVPKEIGEKPAKVQDAPKEIGEGNTYKPNSIYEVDGDKYYTDDNGIVYCNNNDLVPNNTYELNGYKYETDENGRPSSVEGKLYLKEKSGYNSIAADISDIGKGNERSTDDRGHLIGNQFNGAGGVGNLVPQDKDLNRAGGDYYKLETQLANELKAGKDVWVRIDLDYPGKSFRPYSFMVNYKINGEEFVKVFSNETRGEAK